MIKRLLFLTFLIFLFLFFNSFLQDNKIPEEKKILVIINNSVHKLWTKKEYLDSINWSKVKAVITLPDTTALRKYGKKGINGAIIIQYNQIVIPNKPVIK